MPFTPFHLGPALLLGEVFEKRVNMAAIMLGSIIVDARASYCFFTGCQPIHGPLHTYLGATFLAFLVVIGIYGERYSLEKVTSRLRMKQDYSLYSIIFGALIGTWSHVLLDSFLYTDIVPFWPMALNPFYGLLISSAVYSLCIACFIFGSSICFYELHR
ncbi:hypothetical protein J2755_001148 [Methanohalophilus levihalophilus]|uniref:DUF4184 family protein n=1 Tax=Methanohalophilus levihalophilus TaxID=1431282 RepID=UPI001AE868FE|nr:DUF4184 family protein [Methanohalophilus levihalophilus]MBP2030214.1 hypothetical protein [Methanohalophilus levihalophilus]